MGRPETEKNKKQGFAESANPDFIYVGVTRFELATSASLRQRSSQTEPHPELMKLCRFFDLRRLLYK